MERTTRAQLESLCAQIDDLAHRLELLPAGEHVRLDIGSKTYGRAYRLWRQVPGETGHYSLPISDYMGMTANEAWHSMAKVRDGMSWVAEGKARR